MLYPPLRTPVEKVGDQLQAHGLALLRVELGSGQIVAADGGRCLAAVIDAGENVFRVGRGETVGMNEVNMGAYGDSLKDRMKRGDKLNIIPAHMRNF